MCCYQTLFHDNGIGYVVRCRECEKIQLGYSNLVITFTDEDFASFKEWLQRLEPEQNNRQSENLRNIIIPTPCEGMKLLVSRRELTEFIMMLDTADSELRSLEMMELFNQQS
jgi:hypothetical protein